MEMDNVTFQGMYNSLYMYMYVSYIIILLYSFIITNQAKPIIQCFSARI